MEGRSFSKLRPTLNVANIRLKSAAYSRKKGRAAPFHFGAIAFTHSSSEMAAASRIEGGSFSKCG
eukprot:5888132-Pyramimonas_sp.AAC.1